VAACAALAFIQLLDSQLMLLLLTSCFLLGQGMQAREATESHLESSYFRLDTYKNVNGQYPPRTGKTAELLGRFGIDGWKRQLLYEPSADHQSYTLTSLGADGVAGGVGDDLDLVVTVSPSGEVRSPGFEIFK